MNGKNNKVSIIILISSIGLILSGLNQLFEFLVFSNSKIPSLLGIIFSLLNAIFCYKTSKQHENLKLNYNI